MMIVFSFFITVKTQEIRKHITTATDVGDAVGMPVNEKRKWFVAIVNHNTEKSCGEKLKKLNYEVYVPIQKEMHQWKNGRRKMIDRIVLPCLVFIRCTAIERRRYVVNLPFINRFMPDHTKVVNGLHPPAVVPDVQMELFKYILYASDTPVSIEQHPLQVGDKVRVLRGGLIGVEGNVVCHKDGHTDFIVQLDILGYAKMTISVDDLEEIV